MRHLGQLLLRHWKITLFFVLSAVAYTLLTFLTPLTKVTLSKYHLGEFQAHLLQFAIILPYVIIWFIGLLGYIRLQDYTQSLGDSKDGRAFRVISRGILWFVLWLPLSVLVSTTVSAVDSGHHALTADMTRLQNYLNLLILTPAFVYTFFGAKQLVRTIRGQVPAVSQRTTLFFIAFAALYTFVTLQDSARHIALDAATPASYSLPDWLIILTIVIPRLILWYLGVQAVQFIRQYRRKAPGVIYRQALRRLAAGLGVTLLMIVALRLLQSMARQLGSLSLGLLILVLYLLLIGLAIGYVLIAQGARQLQHIEEA